MVLAAVPAEDNPLPSTNTAQQPKVGIVLYVVEVLSIYIYSEFTVKIVQDFLYYLTAGGEFT